MEQNGSVWETIEWLRCLPYTLYSLMFCLVSLRERESNEVSDLPALELSPTLVLVLTCLTVTPLVCQPTIAILSQKLQYSDQAPRP